MAFLSSPDSTNEVNTANIQVSTVSKPVSTVSTHDNTANLSDTTVYAFLANQLNRSQLVREDLEQIHEDDLEEIDLKWQLALLSMRARRYFQRTGKNITINRSDTAGYDKTMVECFNCHKMGHFSRECKSPRNQESRPKNQDSSRKTVNVEDTSSKAMVAIDEAGFDWSYMADDEAPTNMVLMAFSDSEEFQHLEFKGYGPKDSKSICVDTSNKIKKALDALIIEDWDLIAMMMSLKQSSSRAATPVSAARPIYTAAPKPLVNVAKPRQNALQKSHSLSRRPFYKQTTLKNRNLNNKANTAKGDPQDALKDQGYFDSRCSRHITGNICYLTDFKEHVEGMLHLEEELKVMCDKKNSVLFTDTDCFVLSPNFKLADESQVLLKVPRKNNMYNFDMNNIVPQKDLTCLLTKATTDESMLWHKRLEFKNRVMNEFCEEKGIKREYNVAITPQQNRVAERRNRTLIEAARTMLADSKLPTTFWTEAVNTACYVQNKVLVVKPYFNTLYKLLRGRSPALSFMKPFGCHVTILNTFDQLGKIDGKSNEGIFVGYSTISKAFRVYNTRTRKVEENLHITFLENKLMIAGGGPKCLFDNDAFSESMNYAPVSAGTNSNDFAGKRASFDACQSSLETRPSQDYIMMPLWKENSLFDSYSQDSDGHNKDKHGPSQENESDNQEKPNAESNTRNVNTAGPSITTANANDNTNSLKINTVSLPVNTATPIYADYPSDPLMLDLEDTGIFDDAYDDRDEGAEADYNNLAIVISASPIPSTHVHKDHPKEQIIGEMEPKKVTQALDDESWVEAMYDGDECDKGRMPTKIELTLEQSQQGVSNDVLVFRNKRDQRGIVVRNKARLVAQGHRQEEGIEYDEVFSPVAQIEAIRVYKVEKALYGLHHAPRAWYETLSTYLLENRFKRWTIDKTLFIKMIKNDILIVQVYVDDIIFGSTRKSLSIEFEQLMHKRFQMSSMGNSLSSRNEG
nr:hypothetical protein [Tanacetum cinerariifolium]